jgi:hypothetical protein
MARGRKKQLSSRSEIISVRLEPKVRFAAELAGRQYRRTLSGFIEMAVKEMLTQICFEGYTMYRDNLKDATTVEDKKKDSGDLDPSYFSMMRIAERVWDSDEIDRTMKLARENQELLTLEEKRIWKVIQNDEKYWEPTGEEMINEAGEFREKMDLRIELVREDWEEIKKRAEELPYPFTRIDW